MSRMDLTPLQRDGFLAAVPLLSSRECRALLAHFENGRRAGPADWNKGAAATDWLLYRTACNPRLLDLLVPVLGKDIVLWGCSLVRSMAGRVHPWHVDIECSPAGGRYVTAWIGLDWARGRPLQLISGTHRLTTTVQQIRAELGIRRDEASTEEVLGWARERNPSAALCEPRVDDGEAILLNGPLWHASRNLRSRTRSALLLQFASGESEVRMPRGPYEWPFSFVSTPRPPVLVVRGSVSGAANRQVAPPAPVLEQGTPMISTVVRALQLPLGDSAYAWQPHYLFRGSTPIVDSMTCHAAVLSPGHCPHPPHRHDQEELLIILDGEAELLIADKPSADGARVERVEPGDLAYYPAGQHHSIRNSGDRPVTYLMFKWQLDGAKAADRPLGTSVYHYDSADVRGEGGFLTQTVFEGGTAALGHLHCHLTRLAPGAGYEAHADAYDVAILLLRGRVETLEQEVAPNSVVYYAAGRKHGMRNVGDEPAEYLVFEFHAASLDVAQWLRWRMKPFAKRVAMRTARALGVDPHALRARFRR